MSENDATEQDNALQQDDQDQYTALSDDEEEKQTWNIGKLISMRTKDNGEVVNALRRSLRKVAGLK